MTPDYIDPAVGIPAALILWALLFASSSFREMIGLRKKREENTDD